MQLTKQQITQINKIVFLKKNIMSVSLKMQNQKIELIQWLSTVEDSAVIEKIAALRKQENEDWYNMISKAEQRAIEQGIQDAEDGKLHPHSKARQLYEKWL